MNFVPDDVERPAMTVASVKAGVFVAFALLQLVSPGLSLSLSWCDAERTGMIDFDNVEFVESSVVKAPPSVGSYYCLPTETAARIPTTANGTDDGTEEFTRETRTASYIDITDIYESDDEVQIEYTSTSAPPSDALRSSCIHKAGDRRIVELSTDSATFDALENSQLYLTVGAWRMPVRFYANGLHLVSADFEQPVPTRYVYPSSQPVYIAVLVLDDDNTTLSVSSRKSYTVCEKAGNVYDQVDNTILYLELRNPEICTTFPELRDELFHEFVMLVDNKVAFMEKSHWVLVSTVKDCRDEQQREDTARIIFFSSEPEITTTTTLATPDGTPTDERPTDTTGGPSGGVIGGVVVTVVVIIVGTLVVLAIVVYLIRKRWRRPKDPEAEADGGQPREQPGHAEAPPYYSEGEQPTPPPCKETENAKIYVLKACDIDLEKIEVLLANGHPGEIPANADAHSLTSLIHSDSCKTFFVVHQSREKLRTANPVASELVKIFSSRPFPPKILQKFIDIRVYDESEEEGVLDVVEGPTLALNLSLRRWKDDPSQYAKLIRSRALNNVDQTDGGLSYSQTPSATDSPPRGDGFLKTVAADSENFQKSTDPHVSHRPTTPQASHTQQVTASHQLQPPPNYSAVQQQQPDNIGIQIVDQLERMNETLEKSLGFQKKTAEGTEGMAERQVDTLAVVEDTNDAVHRLTDRQDAPEGV